MQVVTYGKVLGRIVESNHRTVRIETLEKRVNVIFGYPYLSVTGKVIKVKRNRIRIWPKNVFPA